jgi:hypothetical protein
VPVDRHRKRCLGQRGITGQESSEQLAIRQVAQYSMVKERFELCVKAGERLGRRRALPSGPRFRCMSFPLVRSNAATFFDDFLRKWKRG